MICDVGTHTVDMWGGLMGWWGGGIGGRGRIRSMVSADVGASVGGVRTVRAVRAESVMPLISFLSLSLCLSVSVSLSLSLSLSNTYTHTHTLVLGCASHLSG